MSMSSARQARPRPASDRGDRRARGRRSRRSSRPSCRRSRRRSAPSCSPRTSSGRMPSGMRLRSSGGSRFSHSVRGTTPNIAPPSRRRNPSDRVMSSRSPSVWPRPAVRERARHARPALLQLDQHAVRGRGMNERHQRAFAPGPRRLVDQPDALRLSCAERRVDVVDAQRDVVDARARASRCICAIARVRRRRLEQFERRLAHRDEVRAHPLRGDFLGRLDLEAERVAIERERRVEVLHGDADVIERTFMSVAAAGRRDRSARSRMSAAAEYGIDLARRDALDHAARTRRARATCVSTCSRNRCVSSSRRRNSLRAAAARGPRRLGMRAERLDRRPQLRHARARSSPRS